MSKSPMPQIDIEITKTGPGTPRSGITTNPSVSVGQGEIRLNYGNRACNRKNFDIDISPTIESMIVAGETERGLMRECSGVQPSRPGLHPHSCGTQYLFKITIQRGRTL